MKPIDLSIIIPAYCSEKTIEACLKACQSQIGNVNYEIIVVDSSPTNKTGELSKPYDKVRIIKLNQKTLPGQARNIGAKEAQGKALVFIDADVYLKSDAIQQMWFSCQNGFKIFSGALEVAKSSTTPAGFLEYCFFNHEFQPYQSFGLRKNLNAGIMIIDKKVFEDFGGFKNLPRMQDTELTERISKSGINLYFVPKVRGYLTLDSKWRDIFRKTFINGNNLYFIRYISTINLRKRLLFFLTLPLIAFIKITRINFRNLIRRDWRSRLLVIFFVPAMYLLGFFWMAGFYKALLAGKGINLNR